MLLCLLKQKRLTEAELHLTDINESMAKLKKQSKNILTKISFGEEDLQRGSTKMRSASVSAPYIPVLGSLFYWNILWLS